MFIIKNDFKTALNNEDAKSKRPQSVKTEESRVIEKSAPGVTTTKLNIFESNIEC